MKKEQKKKKEHKIVFNEQVDDYINTLSISITFITIGLLLYFKVLNFGNETISNILQWCFTIFGILMIFLGFNSKDDNPYKIKGFDSFGIGITFLIVWYLIKGFNFFLVIILAILILLIGIYGTIRGILEILYSLNLNLKNIKTKSISKIITEIIIFLTKLSALALTILNILQALKII